jgi:hypothetical protein
VGQQVFGEEVLDHVGLMLVTPGTGGRKARGTGEEAGSKGQGAGKVQRR